jgi:methionine biosynthesis protein MetW
MTPDLSDTITRMQATAEDEAVRSLSPAQLAELLQRVGEPGPPGSGPGAARWQDALIEQLIPAGASVLDLGCGDGDLLARLIRNRRAQGQGIEMDPQAVFHCVERGVPVLQADLDFGLRGFSDRCFDYVVLEETLQTLHRPAEMLREMLRVGRHGIVSFPNFAHWRVRADLSLRGRMPVTERLPFQWYDTPNIHLLSIRDFQVWAAGNGVRIVAAHVLADGQVRPIEAKDNLLAEEALFVLDRVT